MKLKIFSDLHFEFGSTHLIDQLFNDDVDYYVIAGDLANSRMIIQCMEEINKVTNHPVIFVPGNHEYYHSQKGYIDSLLDTEDLPNIIILNNDTYYDRGVAFIGSTGWWTEGIRGIHTRGMNDFHVIHDIRPNDNGCVWGRESKLFFEKSLEEFKDCKVVCISHNMPSMMCISPEYKNSQLNECFAMNNDDLIDLYQPDLWVCGHTHDSIDMMIHDTRVICNPYGYYNHQVNKEFNKSLIIEV